MTLRLKPVAACVRRKLPPALLWLAGVPALAVELPRPDAGDVARDMSPAPALSAPAGNTSLQGRPPKLDDSAAADDTTPIPVRQIHVTGARLYPQEVLEALVADLNGGTHTLAELMHGAARITQFYRTRGWPLARAYLPAQAVRNGEIEIRVMEGAVSDVRVRAAEGSRLHADVIEAQLAAIQHDAPLEQASVDRALLLLSDLAGANLNATLEAGTQPGQTALTVDSQPAPRWSTGDWRPTTTARATRGARAWAARSTSTAPWAWANRSAPACWPATAISTTVAWPRRCRWAAAA